MVELRYLSKKYIHTSLFFLVQRIQINVQLKEIQFITQFVFIATDFSIGQRMKFQRMEMQLLGMCAHSLTVRNRVHSQKFRTMSGVTYVATFNAVIGSRLFRKQVTLVSLPTSKL